MADKVSEFYQYAVHLVYAIIIALSYNVAIEVFIPIQNFWASYDGFLNGIALLFAYIVVVSGWVGWIKSIQNNRIKLVSLEIQDSFMICLLVFGISISYNYQNQNFSVNLVKCLYGLIL